MSWSQVFANQAVLLFMLPLLLSLACSPAAQAPTEKPSAAAEQPQYGGIMRLFGLSTAETLDALTPASTGQGRGIAGIYETLVDLDFADPDYEATQKVVPGLAERWEMSPDGKSYTFFLRKGVKWHDGEDFTAADILFTYNRVINEKTPLLNYLRDVTKLEAPDLYTVKLTTSVADVEFLGGLTTNTLGIQPKHAADKGLNFKTTAIGTGPFKLGSHDNKTLTAWMRNDNYWRKGLPYLDRVEVIWSLDKPAMLAAFASGNIDDTSSVYTTDYQILRKSVPNLQFVKGPYPSSNDLYFNIEFPPFKDVRVRRAMDLAIDRQDLAKLIAEDFYPNCAVYTSRTGLCLPGLEQMPGWRQPKDQDIAQAKRLLAEAGYPNGFEFKFHYTNQSPQSVPLMEPVVGYLARIGVKAILDSRDRASSIANIDQGNYEATIDTMGQLLPSKNLYNFFHSKGGKNRHGVGSPALDKLIEQQTGTFDVEQRKKLLLEIERIVSDNVWMINFVNTTTYLIAQPWVRGPMILHTVNASAFEHAPVIATVWFDQKLAPKR